MKKITLSIVMLVTFAAFVAGGTFSACSSGSNGSGTAGTTGSAGTGSAGTTGTAGTGSPSDGAAGGDGSASYPVMAADGKCVSGAYSHDGICSCQPDVPTVCSAGCTDTKTDDNNCGGCGHACPATATCNGGVCGPAAATLVPAAAGCLATVGKANLGISIAVAGTTLYFADAGHGTVKSIPVAGGTVTTISSTEKAPSQLAVNGTTIVWINKVAGAQGDAGQPVVTGTIRKSAAGAAPTDVVTAMNDKGGINGLVVSTDGATIYYSSETSIYKIPTAGGTAAQVALEEKGGIPGALSLNGTKISYPTDLNGDVDVITIDATKVAKCGKDGADGELDPAAQINCLRVARSQGGLYLYAMASTADKAVWINGTTLKSNLSAAGSPQANVDIYSADKDIKAMALTADKAYFGEEGIIERAPIIPVPEAKSAHLARGQVNPLSMAVDATKVYWSTGDCAINSTGL